MNALETARALGLTGTDQQVVDILRSLSQANIPAAKVRLWLSDHQLLAWDGASWFGKLESGLASLPELLQAGIRDLKARVLAGDPIRSAEATFGPKVFEIITGIAAAMPEIAGLVDSFYDLDGGRPWKNLTVEAYVAERAQADAAETARLADEAAIQARNEFLQTVYNPAWNTHLAPVLDSGNPLTRQTVADALTAMAAQVRGE